MRVHANAACSVDLRVAGPDGSRRRFSGPDDRERVHRLRADAGAVLVGVGTVLADDPVLTARPAKPPTPLRQPLRVVLDAHLRTPASARVCSPEAATLIATTGPRSHRGTAEVKAFPASAPGRVDLAAVLRELESRGASGVLVEGGPTVHDGFLAAGLVDVFTLYVSPEHVGAGPLVFEAARPPGALHRLRLASTRGIDDGTLFEWVG